MNNSGMDPAVSNSVPKEQRILAVIVFTDVVGFSRLAAQNETRVFVALQRDLTVMTDLCRAHGGQVLNTMGDGMLLCFTSAVDAMSCATEVQRTLHAQAKALPATEVLHHRIGVHLGDIIVKGDNVFGDGVNVAARLQNDARPDSIWYSATVNDVIRNKLKLDSKYVGKRQFKNLGEPVQVWEIPPVAELEARLLMDTSGVQPPEVPKDEGVSGIRAVVLVVLCGLIILAMVLVFKKLGAERVDTPISGSGKLGGLLGRLTPKGNSASMDPANTAPGGASTGGASGTAWTGNTATVAMSVTDAQNRLNDFKRNYDFADILSFLQGPGRVLADRETHADNFRKLDAMWTWMTQQLPSTAGAHIQIPGPDGASEDIFQNGGEGLVRQSAGKTAEPIQLAQLTPAEISLCLQWLGVHNLNGTAPPQMAEWSAAFGAEYPQTAG